MANIEEKIEILVKPKIEELGYQLYDIVYEKTGKDYFLRILIDCIRGIQIEDCEKVTNAINDLLDQADYIKNEYFLEVSSPGIERVLRKDAHLEENMGKEIEIKLFQPFEKQKSLVGTLTKFDDKKIYLTIKAEEKGIERTQIAQIKTKYNW